MKLFVAVLLGCIQCALSDIYLHNPRGSNNRLNEESAKRENANRLFDSQNNNRGGYNVGDSTSEPAQSESEQYRMKYFQSSSTHKVLSNDEGKSFLTIEWTNQHGCGGDEDSDPHKVNCNIVFQYMCQDDHNTATGNTVDENVLRNGMVTNKQGYNSVTNLGETQSDASTRLNDELSLDRGLHESVQYYEDCYVRDRNHGLFLADQNLRNKNRAIHTRQNNGGTRRGFECPEERDYYPYWHPTPWKDIAVLAVNDRDCWYFRNNSFNTKPYHRCVEKFPNGVVRHYSKWNNEQDCKDNNGQWTEYHNFLELAPKFTSEADCNNANNLLNVDTGFKYIWAIPYNTVDVVKKCLVALDPPDCQQAPWSRTNHLGNGRNKAPNNYTWTIPHFPSGKTQRCILRARYNISSDDYNPNTTDYKSNGAKKSPVTNNPYVEIGATLTPLKLAVNTAQFGRTFQDRTHVFNLLPRTSELGEKTKIFNLNVRGKRGNIVQTFPAVEYDFFPTQLNVKVGDQIHVQWEGSNTHNNGAPAGDGQRGDAGQGAEGTDRHNLVEIKHPMLNFPRPIEDASWSRFDVTWNEIGKITGDGLQPDDVAIGFATAGYFNCLQGCDRNPENTQISNLDADMNKAPASYSGAVLKVKSAGTFYYMCSRNNAFTNRSQKGRIIAVS